MNNSLNRLIDGIVIALEREIIPRVDDAYARGQAFAVMDLLRNMRPRLEWSREVTLAQVGLQEAALKRVDDLCRGQTDCDGQTGLALVPRSVAKHRASARPDASVEIPLAARRMGAEIPTTDRCHVNPGRRPG